MKQLRGFKYRFYPTLAQRLELSQTFGCTRFVYNWALALRTNSYYQDNVPLSYTDTSNALTKLKKDPEKMWLRAVEAARGKVPMFIDKEEEDDALATQYRPERRFLQQWLCTNII